MTPETQTQEVDPSRRHLANLGSEIHRSVQAQLNNPQVLENLKHPIVFKVPADSIEIAKPQAEIRRANPMVNDRSYSEQSTERPTFNNPGLYFDPTDTDTAIPSDNSYDGSGINPGGDFYHPVEAPCSGGCEDPDHPCEECARKAKVKKYLKYGIIALCGVLLIIGLAQLGKSKTAKVIA